jgi:hypothetical protein
MPARRRAPEGGRLSELQYSMSVSLMIIKPESRQQNVKLFLRSPLGWVFSIFGGSAPFFSSANDPQKGIRLLSVLFPFQPPRSSTT